MSILACVGINVATKLATTGDGAMSSADDGEDGYSINDRVSTDSSGQESQGKSSSIFDAAVEDLRIGHGRVDQCRVGGNFSV